MDRAVLKGFGTALLYLYIYKKRNTKNATYILV